MQNFRDLPRGENFDPPERIVCAANQYGGTYGLVLAGVRHACDAMGGVQDALDARHCDLHEDYGQEVQGFLTSKYRFVDRKEAWKIAVQQNQIIRLVGSQTIESLNDPETELFSENLY